MWKDFLRALDGLVKTYEALIKLGEKKHAALVAIDMKTLERLLKEEQGLVKKVTELEGVRQKALLSLAAHEKSLTKDSVMTDVIKIAPTDYQKVLTALHKNLSERSKKAKEIADGNSVLAEGALTAVRYHLGRIGGAQVEPTYGSTGGEQVTHKRNFEYDA